LNQKVKNEETKGEISSKYWLCDLLPR